jgi:hypothetical protein
VTLPVVLAAHQTHAIAWGDVPTWIAVIGAIVGAGVALWQLQGQRQEFARQTRILERSQADAVDFAWFPAEQYVIISNLPVDPAGRSFLFVHNTSRRPIRNVTCRVETAGQQLNAQLVGPLLPGNPPQINPWAGAAIPLIRAQEKFGFLFDVDMPAGLLLPGMRTAAEFTDDAGLRWQIDENLHLQQLGGRQQ